VASLRVLHVTPYYADAWGYGGIPRVSVTLARALARRGHAVTVLTTDAGDARSRAPGTSFTEGPDEVRVQIFPNLSNRLAYGLQLFVPLGLGAWLRRHARAFDVAHVHACHHLPGTIAARHLRAAGVPYVLAPHGTAPLIERRRLAKWIFDATLGRGLLAGAARVIAVSAAERRQLLALGVPAPKIEVVPNPIDLSEFSAPIPRGRFRQRLGLDGRPLVLFLGKLTPRKCVDVLVEAMAALPREDAVLVIAGNDLGPGPSIRRLAARRGLAARTIFTGLLRGRGRLEALADAERVVDPSRDEVFGLVPLEALCSGTAVVVADDSGCGEVIDRTGGGRVVSQGDPAALASTLDDMLGHLAHWRDAAISGRARVHALYDPDTVAARMADMYRAVVAAVDPVSVPGGVGPAR
jgi:glycosyltransferase involved in cell wall biosynthesis